MTAVYRRKYREVKTLGDCTFGEALLLTCIEDSKKYLARKINLKRLSEKDRRSVMQEVSLLRKLHRPNLIGYQESFLDDTEVIIVLEAVDLNPVMHDTPLSPQESISTVEELKGELEALYHQNLESANAIKKLQEESEAWKDKYQAVLLEVKRVRTENSDLEAKGRDLVMQVETQLAGWIGEFTGKAGSWSTPKPSALLSKRPDTHKSASRDRGRLPTASQARTSSQPSNAPRISTISLALSSTTSSVKTVRERLSSLRESKLNLESQLKQLQLDLDVSATLSSAES